MLTEKEEELIAKEREQEERLTQKELELQSYESNLKDKEASLGTVMIKSEFETQYRALNTFLATAPNKEIKSYIRKLRKGK